VKATLTYHSLDDSGSAISLPPAAFERHAAWLTSGRVRVLPLDELVARSDVEGDAVAVTFDDGFLNVRGAVERLRDRGVPVTLFVVTGHVGDTNRWGGRTHPGVPTLPLLGWSDLEILMTRGAAIESHTRTHRSLTALASDALDEELQGCRRDLQSRLGVDSRHLAYPYGAVDARVAAHAAASFRYAHTTDYRLVTAADAPLQLPRLDMRYFQAPDALEAWGTPAFARKVARLRLRRRMRALIMANG
jgi:peptidoglycan/xylan/chitin deacetylase (PgdA/CDA1 family)